VTSAAAPRVTGPVAGGAPIVPVVTIDDATRTQRLVEALIAGGIGCVEIALRTPDAMRAIAAASGVPDFVVGAGTVLTAEDVDRVVDAGATFVVSPGLDDEVVARCLDLGVQVIPGVATATEIQRALRWGLNHLKLFPASTVGGVAAIEQFAGPFPVVRFLPSGGVNASNASEYAESTSVFAVSGSWMATRAMIADSDFDEITRLSREAVDLVAP